MARKIHLNPTEHLMGSGVRRLRQLRAVVGGELRGTVPYLPETWTREQIEAEQNLRLKELLRHAASRFPFWRERLTEAGVLYAHGQNIDLTRFSAIPPLERAEVVERRAEFADESWPDITWWDQTGGSTGEPVRILKDAASVKAMRRAKAQMHGWAGKRAGDPVVELWGAERDILDDVHRPPFWAWSLGQRLRCKKLVQNAFRMGEAEMREYLEEWFWFRPHTVQAYAHSIHEMARFAEEEGLPVYRPSAIITSAGTLSDDMRRDIRRVFGAPVFNRYGSREFGNIAMSCEAEGGLHTIPSAAMLEVVRPDGSQAEPGELGEILVTSLTARAMPLIRYRIGDMAILAHSKCPCGRELPLLSEIKGRKNDQFVTISGGYCTGDYFTHMIKDEPGVRKYQVVQEKIDRVRFLIVASIDYDSSKTEPRLRLITKKAIGEACMVAFEYLDDISPNATGKHRFTISHVTKAQERTS